MAQFTVRNLEEDVKTRLKQRAMRHGASMEEQVRQNLRRATLATRNLARFDDLPTPVVSPWQ